MPLGVQHVHVQVGVPALRCPAQLIAHGEVDQIDAGGVLRKASIWRAQRSSKVDAGAFCAGLGLRA
jgi:hypothetical protein